MILYIYNRLSKIFNYLKQVLVFLKKELQMRINIKISLHKILHGYIELLNSNSLMGKEIIKSGLFSKFFFNIILNKKKIYTAVVAHDYYSMQLAIKLKQKKLTKKIILDVVEYPIMYERSKNYRKGIGDNILHSNIYYSYLIDLIKYFDFIIYGNHYYKKLFYKIRIKNSIVFNSNSKDYLIQKKFENESFFLNKKNFFIGIPNSFNETNKPELLIKNIKSLKIKNKKIYLIFVGNNFSGKFLNNLKYLLKKNKIFDNCIFYEKLDYDNFIKLLSLMNCVYFYNNLDYMNLKNLFSNRIFDAITAKVPILINKNCEMAKFIEQHNIGAIYTGSKSNFKKCIKKIISLNNSKKFEQKIKFLMNKFDFNYNCSIAFKIIKNKSNVLFLVGKNLNNRNKKMINFLQFSKKCKIDICSHDNYNSFVKKKVMETYIKLTNLIGNNPLVKRNKL